MVLTLRGEPGQKPEAGANSFVAKLFSLRQLVAKIREILGVPRDPYHPRFIMIDSGDVCMPSTVLTTQEAAEYLRVSKATILRWCNAGKLPAFRIGRGWRINVAELDKIMLGQKPVESQNTSKGEV
jgi:excisionase family DNA binding protein